MIERSGILIYQCDAEGQPSPPWSWVTDTPFSISMDDVGPIGLKSVIADGDALRFVVEHRRWAYRLGLFSGPSYREHHNWLKFLLAELYNMDTNDPSDEHGPH